MTPKALLRSAPILLLALAGCATSTQWKAAGGNKDLGLVRLSYVYSGEEPAMSVAQAASLADSRCTTWGFSRAAPIPGTVRDCTSEDGSRCALWKVTREYHCQKGEALASNPASAARDDRHIDETARAPFDQQRYTRILR